MRRPSTAGAHDRIRTGDLVLTKDTLYRLSYVGQSPAYYSKGGSRFNARRTTGPAAESSGLVNVARMRRSQMDLIFWVLAGLIIYFLFFRPPG